MKIAYEKRIKTATADNIKTTFSDLNRQLDGTEEFIPEMEIPLPETCVSSFEDINNRQSQLEEKVEKL